MDIVRCDTFMAKSYVLYNLVEICISQEKPVILQGACPGRLLMDTYGNRK